MFIQKVPESKTAKNRVHLDVAAGGGPGTPLDVRRAAVDARVADLEAAGATIFRRVEERGGYWVVMQDPEGNEFCVV